MPARKHSTAPTPRARSGATRPGGPERSPRKADREPPAPRGFDAGEALVAAFLANERFNQKLLDLIAPATWRQFPPCSRRRNIATSFAHIHNVRCMRLKMSRKDAPVPARLDRATVTLEEARAALRESAAAMVALIRAGLRAGGRVPNCRADVVGMACASIVHEAHHRGQVAHWARELGAPISPADAVKLWEWGGG